MHMLPLCIWTIIVQDLELALNGIPNIKYLYYNEEWDLEPSKEDITEYREYADRRLQRIGEAIEKAEI
jgi:hypothetical protein